MTFRILSLDGGGSWALIQVRALMALYGADAKGHQILKNFDLAAANSGGSLVLAGLVEDLALGDVLQYFRDETKRRSIFSPTSSTFDKVLEATLSIGPKYSAAAKLQAIASLLPNTGLKPLAGSMNGVLGPGGKPVHLLVPGFDYDSNRAVFFRSAPASGPNWGEGAAATVTLAGAVHASSNAPVDYFDAPATVPGATDRFWDGAITGCNNPTVAGLVEALVLGAQAPEIRMLSIGTGAVALPLAASGATPGPLQAARPVSSLVGDLKKLATAILDDPPDIATFIAHTVTGGDPAPSDAQLVSRIVRMSPLISPMPAAGGSWTAPAGWSDDQFRYLSNIDMDAVEAIDVDYVDSYCAAWLADAAPNQPIRPNGKTLDPWNPELGYARFSDAKTAWSKLFPVI